MTRKPTDRVRIFARMFTVAGRYLGSFYFYSYIDNKKEIYQTLCSHPESQGMESRFTKYELTYKSNVNNKLYKIELENRGNLYVDG